MTSGGMTAISGGAMPITNGISAVTAIIAPCTRTWFFRWLPRQLPATFNMHAVLDSPGPTQGRPLLILVSGFSYDHQYWDPPVGDGKYSFVDAANRAGYATLNLDRLGLGSSDKPPAELTSIQDQADELHQIIQSIKSGALSSYGFSEVVLVGHSVGSAIVQTEAGIYNDADALVLTGFRHEVNPTGAGEFISSIHPAAGEPDGYLTVDNRNMFYDVGHTSRDILGWDASHIGTGTGAELNFQFALDPARSAGITAPVLEVVGDHDCCFRPIRQPLQRNARSIPTRRISSSLSSRMPATTLRWRRTRHIRSTRSSISSRKWRRSIIITIFWCDPFSARSVRLTSACRGGA